MKKICMLTSVHQPFDSRIFQREARSLIEGGYEVSLISPHDESEVVNGVQIIGVPNSRNRLVRWLRGWRIFRLAMKQQAQLYHFHDPELLLIGVLLKLFTRAKVVYDVHEHYPNAIRSKGWIPAPLRSIAACIFSSIEYFIVPLLDGVIYTTPIVGARYIRRAKKSVRLENYPLKRNFARLSLDKKAGIIYSGGIHPKRGIEVAIKALKELKCGFETSLALMGNFSSEKYRIHILELIKRANLTCKVSTRDPVPYKSLGAELSKFLVGIVIYQPTPNNMSCLPNKMFEYMASRTAVVASDFPLYKEIIQAARCGVVVNPTKPEEVGKALEYLLGNPEKAREMGENGRRAVLEKYNWEKESAKLLVLYEELLGETH